jgi:SAM-dependent methyltransferase
MFFTDLPKALREIRRVLKPGGRFTAVAWGPMQQPYFETTIGTILKLFPDLQLPASGAAMFKFGETGTLAHALQEAGFSAAHDEIRNIEWSWPGSAEDVWEYFQAVTIPFAPLFKAVPDTQRERVNQEVIDAILRYKDGEKIRFQGRFTLAAAE